jgi:hypothetical protein
VLDDGDVLIIEETLGPQLQTIGVAAPLETNQFVVERRHCLTLLWK